MDTNTLQAFIAVAESSSFSKAADHLYLTQSAISKRIALLEDQLNSKLFDRIGRTVSLTEAGNSLLPRAKDILLQLDDAKRAIGNLTAGEVTGGLSLAASHHISLHRLPPHLKQFSKEYPKVELDLQFAESEVAYEGVLKGDFELALITLSPEPEPSIHSDLIWDDLLMYVVAKDHPLAKKDQINLEELTHYNAILPSSNTFTRSLVETLFLQHELTLNVTMSTNYLDTIRMMVTIGLGWSLLPQSLVGKELKVLNVVDSEPVHRNLGIIYHRNRTLSNAASHLVQMLKSQR
ncbi:MULTISPECIES: LysR family transcriptional regulator [unclassified Neptuniibacter]|uniref:LysR family transcriptional regulator n=1 Tax=unclassified Neptuniibacter TaxID=2630693 RepID=UPI0026E1F84C|nr:MULTISPECIES: LysR family transcriptional regulator [unclassified Neptuniibacter]MDO6513209.1 LysR family transcriptional regulator [Neptuniibacter sp. 2_MG-2023]MDO6592379.1 LysR family transcriptional regulator [Neptuniibacter sp. 1_MG-2023]